MLESNNTIINIEMGGGGGGELLSLFPRENQIDYKYIRTRKFILSKKGYFSNFLSLFPYFTENHTFLISILGIVFLIDLEFDYLASLLEY